ncbi:MAG TPA: amino acid adenylation domain-containing protein [Verrucomicrobiae bacterium]|nr:amino acid adenylation domain-containing protein [Verrucomicrobiae bacterium]
MSELNTVDKTLRSATGATREETPLTAGQESIYILSRLGNNLPVYNMPFAFRVHGALHMRAFMEALRLLVARHHALRSKIVETDRGLRQVVSESTEPAFEFHDLSKADPGQRENEFRAELRGRASAAFDLSRETAFRTDLFRLADDDFAVLFNLHHTFGDMSALRILFRDFQELYSATLAGRSAALPEIGLQMDAYASRAATEQPTDATLKFWRDRLAGFATDLELPADGARASMPSFKGAIHNLTISNSIATAMKTLARTNKCSSYMAFLAIVQTLVYRYTNQRQFAIATPFSRRIDPELENTIGYLINLLPIPISINPRATFRDLLADVRKGTLDVFAHENISMRRILQETKIAADNPRNALNRVVFQYFAEGPAELTLEHLQVEPISFHTGTSKFDLCITMLEREGAVHTEVEYDSDLFQPATIERLGQHLVHLAEAAARNPDAEIGQFNFLTASEKCFIAEVNETKTAYPRDAAIDQLFEQQAANHPAKPAISFDNTVVTYGELNRRADQIAQFLIKRGVRSGDFVGVCLDRSPTLMAALIGILKAGAAFVPFDAKYPAQRLQYMFEDAGVRLLLTSAEQQHIAPASVEVALVEQAAGEGIDDGVAKKRPLVSPDSLAYMMYTSGSTGNPKGVTVPHRAIIRLVKSNDFASFSPDEVFLLFAPVSFDASTLEIWGPLLNGGTLAMYPPNFESLEQLDEVLTREKVTTLWLSSGLFNTVVDKKIESLRNVRQLLVGGDVVSPAHVRRLYDANANVTIINGYGPTENTTFTCCYTIPRDWPIDRAIPIGRPIRNTQVYILDENLQPMPVGIPGELYCGGDGLSHGYWNKPDLTAQVFVAHPFFAGARLYRTGDRVRLLKDGNLEFLGRLDSQIKIRGFRIELGEIETALRSLPGIEDAAACVDSAGADGKRLLGFVVAQAGHAPVTKDIHEKLHVLLPEHACPSRIFIVDKLPLGANGKVDRKALVQNAAIQTVGETESVALSPTETAIAGVWKEILKLLSIGPDENFFHLGGDSLRAIQSVLQINRAVGSNLTITHVFQAPTVRGLAKKIDAAKTQAMPSIRRARSEDLRRSADVAALSDAEVDSLLAQLLAKEK